MGIAKGWGRYALVAVCAVGALLSGCSRDPNVRKQKYLESGERYFDKGQYREADIQFRNAIQVNDKFAEAHYRLGLTALKLEQWRTALDELENATELQPDHYPARLELADLEILGRRYADAKEQLDVLVEKDPNNPAVYIARSNYDFGVNNAG